MQKRIITENEAKIKSQANCHYTLHDSKMQKSKKSLCLIFFFHSEFLKIIFNNFWYNCKQKVEIKLIRTHACTSFDPGFYSSTRKPLIFVDKL